MDSHIQERKVVQTPHRKFVSGKTAIVMTFSGETRIIRADVAPSSIEHLPSIKIFVLGRNTFTLDPTATKAIACFGQVVVRIEVIPLQGTGARLAAMQRP